MWDVGFLGTRGISKLEPRSTTNQADNGLLITGFFCFFLPKHTGSTSGATQNIPKLLNLIMESNYSRNTTIWLENGVLEEQPLHQQSLPAAVIPCCTLVPSFRVGGHLPVCIFGTSLRMLMRSTGCSHTLAGNSQPDIVSQTDLCRSPQDSHHNQFNRSEHLVWVVSTAQAEIFQLIKLSIFQNWRINPTIQNWSSIIPPTSHYLNSPAQFLSKRLRRLHRSRLVVDDTSLWSITVVSWHQYRDRGWEWLISLLKYHTLYSINLPG